GLSLYAGASISLVDHFHPAETLERVQRDGVTMIAAVPAMFAAWLSIDEQHAPSNAFAQVRLAVSGATHLPVDVAHAMQERFGLAAHNRYGLTAAERPGTPVPGARKRRGLSQRPRSKRRRAPVRSDRRCRASKSRCSMPTAIPCSR